MVFASIREHASTAIFLRAGAEIKNLLCEQLREYNLRAASTSYIFRLQQSISKSFSLKIIKQNILKRGFNLECSKFFEASLSDTLSKSNQLQSRLMPNDVTFSLHHARVGTDQKAKVTRRTTIYNNNI